MKKLIIPILLLCLIKIYSCNNSGSSAANTDSTKAASASGSDAMSIDSTKMASDSSKMAIDSTEGGPALGEKSESKVRTKKVYKIPDSLTKK